MGNWIISFKREKMKIHFICLAVMILLVASCKVDNKKSDMENSNPTEFTGAENEVRLIILDPGHFHAALVQKSMYEQMDPLVHVYADKGPDVQNYLKSIQGYNSRSEDPTSWKLEVYTGPGFLERMLQEKPGNLMVVSGNNAKKTGYLLSAVEAGINVLADKPMIIEPVEFADLEKAFQMAEKNGVLLYDIMTERYEITTIMQRELSMLPQVFGELEQGTPEEPGITKESVHHFFKYVSGNPVIRPAWFFDATQQGESIADVGTHLVDLIQWEAFPGVILKKGDVEMVSARTWSTDLNPEMFKKVTGLDEYPGFLEKYLNGDILQSSSNGEMIYKLKDIYAKVSVIWNFQAPEGTGDTHYSIMRGTKANLIIRQGEEEGYIPILYIEAGEDQNLEFFSQTLEEAIDDKLQAKYPGIKMIKAGESTWKLEIPDSYRVGHEAHFAQVTEKYLNFLVAGEMPAWEVPNMIVKYYTTTEGLKAAKSLGR
jgi:predicted dehydrogenase